MQEEPSTLDTVPGYRIMILKPDKSVAEVRQIFARDDREAMELARATGGGNAVELWDGLRYIEHFQLRIGV